MKNRPKHAGEKKPLYKKLDVKNTLEMNHTKIHGSLAHYQDVSHEAVTGIKTQGSGMSGTLYLMLHCRRHNNSALRLTAT